MSETIRVLLVDDHAMVRTGIKSLLERAGDLEVVGEAEDGDAGVRLAQELQPDVVVMDISMPGMDGLEATQALRKLLPDCRVLILSNYGGASLANQARKTGVDGYVLKRRATADLTGAVRAVAGGGEFFKVASG